MSSFFQRLQAPKGTISITLDKTEYSLKEPLTGRINVTAAEDIEVDEVRLEYVVTEWTRATQTVSIAGNQTSVTAQQSSTMGVGKITLLGKMHLPSGSNQSFPLYASLPQGLPPTYRGRNATNTWIVKGVMAVKGRPDVVGHEMGLQVNP